MQTMKHQHSSLCTAVKPGYQGMPLFWQSAQTINSREDCRGCQE